MSRGNMGVDGGDRAGPDLVLGEPLVPERRHRFGEDRLGPDEPESGQGRCRARARDVSGRHAFELPTFRYIVNPLALVNLFQVSKYVASIWHDETILNLLRRLIKEAAWPFFLAAEPMPFVPITVGQF